jgi:hypothetical protein
MEYCKVGLRKVRVSSVGNKDTANSSIMVGFNAHIPIIELLALAAIMI